MNDVNGRQLSVMIFFIPLVFKMSMLPSYLYKTAGVDGYVIVGLFAVAEFVQLWAVLWVCSKGGMQGIRARYGDGAYFALSAPLLMVIFIKCLLFISEIVNYLSTFLFYNIVDMPLVLTLMVVCYYFSYKGARSIARIFELSVWLVPVIFLMGLIFGETEISGDCLLPVFAQGGGAVPQAVAKYLVYTFDFSPLLFCNVKVKSKGRIALFSFLSVVALVGCYMLFYCRYGRAAFLIDCAFARLASFDTVISQVGSLDWISCILWVTVAVLNLSLKLNAVAEIGTGVRIKRHLFAGAFCLLLTFVLLKGNFTMKKTLEMVTGGVQYAVFGIEILLPAVMGALYMRKQGGNYAPKP